MAKASLDPAPSRDDFLQDLGATGLFSGEELSRVLSALPGSATTGHDLATQLTAAGTLTSFQAEAVLEQRIDELVLGNYEVLAKLGAGGMGAVYKARHRRMKRIVAIKVLSRAVAGDATFLQRFQREVEVVAQLSHPNIVMAYDADEAEAGPFLVMEFVDGKDLASVVQTEGPMSVAAAVAAILQAARGLAYAHGQGIVHRDIKPANLLRDGAGIVKVADLGLARLNVEGGAGATVADGALTQAGSIVGTVDYMAPEQALDSSAIDHRVDIYALGCTLYFVLTGKAPFAGMTLMATLLKHRDAPIPSLRAARPEVPAALDEVYQRMLAKQPADRWATMDQVVQALETALAPPSLASGTVSRAPAPDHARPSVLLVEPSRVQASIVRGYLQEIDAGDVQTANAGRAALEAVRAAPPRLIVSAMHLPDLTGVELARQVRALPGGSDIGFVLVASEADGHAADAIHAISGATLLHKPFDRPRLEQAIRQLQPTPAAHTDRASLRILLVDDSTTARMLLRQMLAKLGVTHVTDVSSGARALAMLEQATFDLVLTDLVMAGMDGKELAVRIRAQSAMPVVVMTATTDPALEQELMQAGVTAVCDKAGLADAVGGVLDRLTGSHVSGS